MDKRKSRLKHWLLKFWYYSMPFGILVNCTLNWLLAKSNTNPSLLMTMQMIRDQSKMPTERERITLILFQ